MFILSKKSAKQNFSLEFLFWKKNAKNTRYGYGRNAVEPNKIDYANILKF